MPQLYYILSYTYFNFMYYITKLFNIIVNKNETNNINDNHDYNNLDYHSDKYFTHFLSEMDKIALSKKEER